MRDLRERAMKHACKKYGVGLVLLLMVTGCASGSAGDDGGGSTAAPGATAGDASDPEGSGEVNESGQGEPITVGAIAPLSGGGADYGTAAINGFEMAIQEINEGGGVTVGGSERELQVETCDDAFESSEAAACATRLTQRSGAEAIFTFGTYATVPVMEMNERDANPFLLMGGSGSPRVTQVGNELYVRTWSSVGRTIEGWIEELRQVGPELESVGIVATDDEYGQVWTEEFTSGWQAAGGTVVGSTAVDPNDTDFYSALTPLIDQEPDALLLTTVCDPSSVIISQSRELGFEGTFINTNACDPSALLESVSNPDDINGTLLEVSTWNQDTEVTQYWSSEYQDLYAEEPQLISAVAYTTGHWYADALEDAGDTNPGAVRDALENALADLPKEENLLSWANLDENGDFNWPMHVAKIEDGNVTIPAS